MIALKKFCKSLREHTMKITNFLKRKLLENENYVFVAKKCLKINILRIKSIVKLETIVIIQVDMEVLHIRM